MPELPEVETVRRGLAPAMVGARIVCAATRRADLRFPFPPNFEERLAGATILSLDRRGKFLTAALSSGEHLILHLGMTGRFSIVGAPTPGDFYYAAPADALHDHVVIDLDRAGTQVRIIYNDVRRFGFMDLAASPATSPHLASMGPEPMDDAFSAEMLSDALAGRATPIKAALLDQKTVAGLGNIYVCEALFLAGLSPKRAARTVCGARGVRLHAAIRSVLAEAIEAGGSTLRDFAAANGARGGFQQRFKVYDREGAPCPKCAAAVRRIVQSGRSTFYCGRCQR